MRAFTHRTVAVRAAATCLLVLACAEPPVPAAASAELESRWESVVDSVLDRASLTPLERQRISAYAAMASYEGHASEERNGLRSLAGQLNGLWSFPGKAGSVDGAIVAGEAQRVLLDSMLPASSGARAHFDSLTKSVDAARRERGVSRAVAERSAAHGVALGKRVLEWIASGQATLVLRHARECTAAPERGRSARATVAQAGDPAPPPARNAAEAAERRLISAMTRVDLAASVAPVESCVGERVRSRLRTRPPSS